MKIVHMISKLFLCISLCLLSFAVNASTPLWTFTPLTATTIEVPSNSTATISYTVTNQSSKSHTLTMKAIQGITQITSGAGVCGNPFTLASQGSSCILSLLVTANQITNNISDGPVVCQQNSVTQCYRPGQANTLHITLGTPLPTPTLSSINASSGTAAGNVGVTLTGTNLSGTSSVTLGGTAATDVNVVSATSVTAVTPAHAAGAVDVVITTAGGSATLTNGYTYVTTAIGQSSGGGTIGCLGGGLQNLIAATVNNSNGIEWGNPTIAIGPSAESDTDGATNTTAIVSTLGAGTSYAAGLCSAYEVDSQGNTPCVSGNACYNDWYLPAKDQLNCFYTNKTAIGGFDNNGYWTSTEDVFGPTDGAWFQEFFAGIQNTALKSISTVRVRCARSFTP